MRPGFAAFTARPGACYRPQSNPGNPPGPAGPGGETGAGRPGCGRGWGQRTGGKSGADAMPIVRRLATVGDGRSL